MLFRSGKTYRRVRDRALGGGLGAAGGGLMAEEMDWSVCVCDKLRGECLMGPDCVCVCVSVCVCWWELGARVSTDTQVHSSCDLFVDLQ